MASSFNLFYFLASLVVALLGWLVMWQKKQRQIDHALSNIPSPPGGLPIVGHALEMLTQPPWEVMENFARKYGTNSEVVKFRVFNDVYIVFANPDHFKRVFQTNFKNYQKDRERAYQPFLVLLGNGLVTSEGELWKKQRQLILSAFRVEILSDVVDIAKRAVDRLSEKLETFVGTSKAVEIDEEFRHLTLQVIGEAVLSLSAKESDDVFPRLYLPIINEANKRVWHPYRAYLPNPTYSSAVSELNKFMKDIIAKRWEERKTNTSDRKKDILDRLLDGVEEGTYGPDVQNQLCDELKTFILAGHETSSMMLTWAIFELARHPDALEKCRKEADECFGRDGEILFDNYSDKCTYALNCLKEAIRLYSIVPLVTRTVVNDDQIGEYLVPRGAKVVVPIRMVHHNPKFWPNPLEYQPERFFQELKHPYAFIPFIAGPRNCIGQHFSLLETKIVLSQLVRKYNFTITAQCADGKVHPFMIPICPRNGLWVHVSKRSEPSGS